MVIQQTEVLIETRTIGPTMASVLHSIAYRTFNFGLHTAFVLRLTKNGNMQGLTTKLVPVLDDCPIFKGALTSRDVPVYVANVVHDNGSMATSTEQVIVSFAHYLCRDCDLEKICPQRRNPKPNGTPDTAKVTIYREF